jgi:hypothetical protein
MGRGYGFGGNHFSDWLLFLMDIFLGLGLELQNIDKI